MLACRLHHEPVNPSLALQLRFSFKMCGACFGLMGAPPQ